MKLTRAGLKRKWLHQTPGVSGVRDALNWTVETATSSIPFWTWVLKINDCYVKYFHDRTVKIVLYWTTRLSNFPSLATQRPRRLLQYNPLRLQQHLLRERSSLRHGVLQNHRFWILQSNTTPYTEVWATLTVVSHEVRKSHIPHSLCPIQALLWFWAIISA